MTAISFPLNGQYGNIISPTIWFIVDYFCTQEEDCRAREHIVCVDKSLFLHFFDGDWVDFIDYFLHRVLNTWLI